ncbi:MAG TPA: DUF2203 domain-containing protein [Terracidiphilus sp.]|nr:DUF2203 domain-containing protein [Terracidiphilus sp.]
MKMFTLDEAQALLPVLEALLKRALDSKQAAAVAELELAALAQKIYLMGGMRVDVAEASKQRAVVDGHLQRARESVAEIDSIGVQVKDLDAGLLDFPCRVEDQVVLLCWRMGESSIDYWHTLEAGFKGRQPLDERFRRRPNSSPNSNPNSNPDSNPGNKPN